MLGYSSTQIKEPRTKPSIFVALIQEVDKEVRREVEQATEQAINDGILPVEALYCDLYANTGPTPIRGATVDEIIVPTHATSASLLRSIGAAVKT